MKENKVLNWFYHKRVYFLAFLIPVVVLFAVFAAFGYYPFGDYCPLVLDLNGQYVYYFETLRDAVWGDGSIFMSWSRNLSGEFLGIFAYYLASPFTIIVMLLPRTMILESIMIMQLAKIGTMAVTMAFYLRNSKKITDNNILIFGSLYALMAYAVVQLMDPMWLDGLIYLPLITYGIEKLIDKGKKLYFIIPLALMFMANFYIGWMIALFCVLYFFYYYFFAQKEDVSGAKPFFTAGIRFAISAITAALCAAAILIPVYYSLKLGKLEFTTPNFGLKPQFPLFDFFTKLLPETYDTVRPEGLPFVYCGTLSLIMFPLYFLNSNIDKKKKIGNGALLTVLLLCMYLSTIDIAWHGFQVPNWLPYRYSFIFSFIMLVMAAEAFERIEGITHKQLGGTFVALFIYVIYIDKMGLKHASTTGAIWFTLVCLIGYLLLILHYKKHAPAKTASIVVLILVVGELFGGSLQTLKSINSDVVYSKHSSYVGYIDDGRKIMADLTEMDDGLYRTEKTFHRTVNDAMAFKMKGISHSSSTLNAGAVNFLDRLGFTCGGHYTKYKGHTYVTDAILGIKYIITKDADTGYTEAVLSQDGMTVYKNPDALPIGYMVNDNIINKELLDDDPFVNQNKLLSGMLYDDGYVEFFKRIPVLETRYDNVDHSEQSAGHTHYKPIVKGANAHIEFLFDVPTDDVVYMFLPAVYIHDREVNVWINNQYAEQYFGTDNYNVKTIGRFNAGENVSVITTITKEDCYMKDQWFYYLDEDMFHTAVDQLKEQPWNITEFSETHLEGTVSAKDGQILFTSISYEPGWTVKVDGEKVEPVKLLEGVIGIPVPAGDHTVTMDFFPHGLAIGLVLTAVGIVLVVVFGILEKKQQKILLKRLYK